MTETQTPGTQTSGAAMVPGEIPGQGVAPHETAAPEPGLIEGPGRYKIFPAPDGGWVIARATGLCEKCGGCGCGEQAEPVQVPGMVVQLARQGGAAKMLGMRKGAAKARRR
jgi:hypothetical protein